MVDENGIHMTAVDVHQTEARCLANSVSALGDLIGKNEDEEFDHIAIGYLIEVTCDRIMDELEEAEKHLRLIDVPNTETAE